MPSSPVARRISSTGTNSSSQHSSNGIRPLELDDRDGILSSSPPPAVAAVARRCAGCLWFTSTTFAICHPIVTLVLTLVVVMMGIQLRSLQVQLAAEDAAIALLQEQLAQDQATQQDLGQRVEQEHSLTLYQMAGTFTLLTCLITAFHITQHLSNFHEMVVQRKILAILWMR